MDLSRARAIFFDESRELCDILETALLDRKQYPATLTTFDLLFRTAHTIKGSAGVFGLDALVRFTHVMENVLERLRFGQVPLNEEVVTLLLNCNDHLRSLIEVGERDELAALHDLPETANLMKRLHQYQDPSETTEKSVVLPDYVAQVATIRQSGTSPYWQLSLRFHPETFRLGFDPLSFINYLSRLGTISHVEAVWRSWPHLAELDPIECFFGLEMTLQSDADEAIIRGTFDFLAEDSLIGILPPHAALADYRSLAEKLAAADGSTIATQAARWHARHALSKTEMDLLIQGEPAITAMAAVAAAAPLTPVPPPAPLASTTPTTPLANSASEHETDRNRSRNDGMYVRVEAAKLDRLINRVGELVIAASGTTILTRLRQDVELMESVALINSLVEKIRDDALTLRMVPVGDIFGRFPRMVRDISRQLGKEIHLDIKGADTEIDKSMVEKLTDPLMHIVRNALDHGIESPEQRRLAGKPPLGTLRLNAYHDAGSVVIEISDDGNGINREKILRKAIERGLTEHGQLQSDQEILQLIFQPGFSTADTVSDLSGRGFGMDVVKLSIEGLRGVIEIDSQVGSGTRFRLRMPLTLAIIDGFRVEVDDAILVMPLDMMYECVDMPLGTSQQNTKQINVRGEWLPFVSLRDMFGLAPSTKPEYVVIVNFGNNRAGIVVDRLLGEVQAVIKPLGDIFKSLRGISGSTILGNGRPALVLDIPQLIEHALRRERKYIEMKNTPEMPVRAGI